MAGTEAKSAIPGFISPDIRNPQITSKLKETFYDGTAYTCPTWEQMGEFTFELAKSITDSGQRFDRVIALAKGGLTWSRTLVDYLDIDKLSTVRYKSYRGVNEAGKPELVQPLADAIVGENILLFDEVIDSGETIDEAVGYIGKMGAKVIQTAGLCYKPRSKVRPDFFAFQSDAWVVFPHEIREFVEGSAKKWLDNGLGISEIHARLVTIGVPSHQASHFLQAFI